MIYLLGTAAFIVAGILSLLCASCAVLAIAPPTLSDLMLRADRFAYFLLYLVLALLAWAAFAWCVR